MKEAPKEQEVLPQVKLSRAERLFFISFFVIIGVVVIVTFFRYFIWQDYYVKAETDCDPATEKCFIYTCDPETEEDCPEDEAERISYYKYILKKAYSFSSCDSESSDDCPPPVCSPGDDCREILCDENTVGEDEECNDPEKYLEEQAQLEEESEECDPEDTECISGENNETVEECDPNNEECPMDKSDGSGESGTSNDEKNPVNISPQEPVTLEKENPNTLNNNSAESE